MIRSAFNSLEDSTRSLLGPTYWILRKTGLILPDNKLGKLICIVIHEIVSFFVFTQYMELYIIRSNLDLVLTNLKISMLSFVCIAKSNTFIIWQSTWKEIMNYITESDEYERNTNDPSRKRILDKYTKYCRSMTYYYWILVFTTFWTTIGTPLIRYSSSTQYRESLRNGTELFPHIFSSWMPLDKYHSPGCWVTVAWHIILCAYGALIMAAYDTSIMVIMVYFGGKLDLLQERCKQMLGTDGVAIISDDEFEDRVRELHKIHVLYLRYSRLFNSMLSPVMFIYMVMCSLMLCASAFQLTSATNAVQKLLMAEYLIFGIAQLFIFCWHSNDVLEKNENVMLGPYESGWSVATVKQRRSVLLLAGQLRISQVFTAGPFTNLTLSTFITVFSNKIISQVNNSARPNRFRILCIVCTYVLAIGAVKFQSDGGASITVSALSKWLWLKISVLPPGNVSLNDLFVLLQHIHMPHNILKGAYSYYTLLRK